MNLHRCQRSWLILSSGTRISTSLNKLSCHIGTFEIELSSKLNWMADASPAKTAADAAEQEARLPEQARRLKYGGKLNESL